MNEQRKNDAHTATGRAGLRWRRGLIATLIGSLALGAGASAFAHGPGGWHGGRGGFCAMHGGPIDPETAAKRAEFRVKFMLNEVGASEAQQAKAAEIVRAAATELAPLREKHRTARREAIEFLSQPTIDRNGLEALRAEQMRLADAVSKRMVQTMADVAEVLTPEQRAALAEKMQNFRGRRGRS
jgi:Spy/CpxP family protein refolding chaperone